MAPERPNALPARSVHDIRHQRDDFEEAAEGERVFSALAEDGKVQMPFQPTFWASWFGMLVDRFGIPGIVNAGHVIGS